MSLTATDLDQIRTLIREEVRHEVEVIFETRGREIIREEISIQLQPLEGRVEALENDVKDIYHMLTSMQKQLAS